MGHDTTTNEHGDVLARHGNITTEIRELDSQLWVKITHYNGPRNLPTVIIHHENIAGLLRIIAASTGMRV